MRDAALALLFALLGAQAMASTLAPPSSTEITDRYGKPLRTTLSEDMLECRPVALAEISEWMVLATVAVEDKRFFEHGGVDLAAVARAAEQNAAAGKIVSGA